MQRNHPTLPKNRKVLHYLCLQAVEAVSVAAISVVVIPQFVQPTVPRIAGGRSPIYSYRSHAVQEFWVCAKPRSRGRRIEFLNRREFAEALLEVIVLIGKL